MLKSLVCICVIQLLVCFQCSKSHKDDTIDIPPLNQSIPFIMIKVGDHLQLPDGVSLFDEGKIRSKKKLHFTAGNIYFEDNFYCPKEDENQKNMISRAMEYEKKQSDIMQEKVDEHCLVIKYGTKVMPIPSCKTPPHPKIMKILGVPRIKSTENNIANREKNSDLVYKHITCGPSDLGKTFGFGYQVCVEYEGNNKKLKSRGFPFKKTREGHMYEFCYSDTKNEIMFTIHTILAPMLLFKNYLKIEREKIWDMESYDTVHIPGLNFENVESMFKQVEMSSLYRIQLLIPPADFPLLVWKRPVFHYANTSLIHKDLQLCWNTIHDMIRQHAIDHFNHFEFYTGAFKLSEKMQIKIIKGVEIPDIWVKVVHHSPPESGLSGVAIIANNYRDEEVSKLITEMYNCNQNLCIGFITEKFSNISDDIRCCKLNNEIEGLFGEEAIFNQVLTIDGLIVTEGKEQSLLPRVIIKSAHIQSSL